MTQVEKRPEGWVYENDQWYPPRGYPRPYAPNGLPVPWVSPEDNLKQVHEDRHLACILALLCQVCGYQHMPGIPVIFFVNQEGGTIPKNLETAGMATAMDDAVLHTRCAKLTLGRCPGVGGVRDKGRLHVVETTSEKIIIRYFEEEEDPSAPRLCCYGKDIRHVWAPREFMERSIEA